MSILWFCILVLTVFSQTNAGFGNAYLKNSRLCQQWSCVNNKLGLPEDLPPLEQYAPVLKSLLPDGPWQDAVEKVLDVCFRDRPRRYTNTCPGQALLHCTVDNLIQNCPKENLRKSDACAPLTSLAGFRYMFTQSRYENLEMNLPTERRPSWFLKNYFSSKCCNLPDLINSTILEGCGFSSLLNYHTHAPRTDYIMSFSQFQKQATTTHRSQVDKVQVVDISENNFGTTSDTNQIDSVKVVNIDTLSPANQNPDPLDCCDISGFIDPAWRSECDFQLTWDKDQRINIKNTSDSFMERVATTETPTTKRPTGYDVKILPQSCEKETCVFSKLGIVSSGKVDLDAFSKLLDNMTAAHNSWVKAKARVVTKCLRSSPVREYVDECEINKVLACTFDVLSENCPHAKKQDPCRHSNVMKSNITCQISSSKYRPKNRRQFCGIPNFVNHEVLAECGLSSLNRMEYVSDPVTPRPKTHWWSQAKFACKGSTDSTKCVLKKMGVLNKYGFLDYFKMKDRIRTFALQDPAWSAFTDIYLNTFTQMPMYGDQCSTPKKFLNVLDSMLITCPMSKRKHTLQCNRILTDMATSSPNHQNMTRDKLIQVWRHFQHTYLSDPSSLRISPLSIHNKIPPRAKIPVIHRNHLYSGILSSNNAPPVEIIDLKQTQTKRPLVLLPVYLRKNTGSLSVYDGIMRGGPLSFDNTDSRVAEDFIPM